MKLRTSINNTIGYYPFGTMFTCLEILDIINGIDDYIILRFDGKVYRRKIYNDLPKGPYFRWANTRVYLLDIVRTD